MTAALWFQSPQRTCYYLQRSLATQTTRPNQALIQTAPSCSGGLKPGKCLEDPYQACHGFCQTSPPASDRRRAYRQARDCTSQE
jgi:hypothetical protein